MNRPTQIFHITSPDDPAIEIAANVLREGGTVVFPTETVYGLGANALSEQAIQGIYTAKGRPSDNPLIVHIARWNQLDAVARIVSEKAQKVAEVFWPGPLTIIFPKTDSVPYAVTAGLETVAVRMPVHPLACRLIDAAGVPVAAPSANISGKPSPTRGVHVIEDLDGRVDVILWGDDSPVGLESTVLDMTVDPPMVLRPGGITLEALQTVLPEIGMDPALLRKEPHLIPKSPGMKYTHYAPDAEMILFEGVSSDLPQVILQEARLLLSKGKRVGILTVDEHASVYSELGVVVRSLGASEDSEGQAHNLFSRLREFNGDPVDVILAESVSESGLGQAVMNRLRKASTKKVPVGRG